ncbi:MAG TPA: tail fiber protein [Allosphingosinicella sp.]|jgi:microcystin-dependent protein|nr:tail fiber protein [Allosphingosinicella sp.]
MSESVMASSPQPTLTLQQLVGIVGPYPEAGKHGAPQNWQGMIHIFAGVHGTFGAPPAHGQTISTAEETAGKSALLYYLFGFTYGDDGEFKFGIPNLRGLIAVGGTPRVEAPPTLRLTAVIAAESGGVMVGSIGFFGGKFAPPGWLACDGTAYSFRDYPQLHAAIGATFGGDGGSFRVPDLSGRAAVGAGSAPGIPAVALGQSVMGPVPGLGLTAMIAVEGDYPNQCGPGEFPLTKPFVGQILFSATPRVPAGWLPADGRELPIPTNMVLYSVLGNAYGGDQRRNFALPDLRGRMVVGQ